jgi:hypothetical protein
MAACGAGQTDHNDCVQLVREMKTATIPCTRNVYQKYTVKVPRQVKEQVPRNVTYTDYETVSKQVPVTVNRPERRVRMETQKYQVPVTRYYKKTVMETRERQVPVPYIVNHPETQYRTVNEKVPVQRSKVQMEDVVKTVYDIETRTRCVPETRMISKQIPVYKVVTQAPPPCPQFDDSKTDEDRGAFDPAGSNNENIVSYEEYVNDTNALAKGNVTEVTNDESKYVE